MKKKLANIVITKTPDKFQPGKGKKAKSIKKKMTMTKWEGSKEDKKIDKKLDYKEGSKKDNAKDKQTPAFQF